MNGGRNDASTSTDDIKGRPLCLFYFSHPFGVLSPEPPTVAAAPPHVARTYINMQPAPSTFCYSPDSDCDYGTSSTSRPAYDLGDTAVHRNPVLRSYALDLGRRDSLSSSLFSSDVWFSSSASSRTYGGERRVIPYNRLLPPLRLPTPRDLAWDSSDDVWPKKCLTREKFSLPPIELPCAVSGVSDLDRVVSECGSESVHVVRCRRTLVNRHRRRTRLSGVQRMVTCLMKRTVKGHGARVADDLGFPDNMEHIMRYVHGVLGTLLLVVNLLLLVAAVYESDSLCEVYLWFMVVFWVVTVVSSLAVATSAIVSGHLIFAGVYLSVMFLVAILLIYFMIVVGNYRMTVP